MSAARWPELMPEGGRLPQSKAAREWGAGKVADPRCECRQTIHISLFFDGTNNNDDEDNTKWRDSLTETHTNIARLYNVARDVPSDGVFSFYIPGVGTPFPKLGEPDYSQDGKAFADGFGQRCVWGMTRVLNAVHYAITRDVTNPLVRDSEAKAICDAAANGNVSRLMDKIRILGITHSNRIDDGPQSRAIQQIWINAFGFSRGAACARAFVHNLINKWGRNDQISDQAGHRALPYAVNFLGLFDTVASVGMPDSTRAALKLDVFDGHFHFASGGALDVPTSVRRCAHFYSIHEQRMSFPLDTIREGQVYPNALGRAEVGYPGVHSDVGGGYAPGEQGKARDGDSSKLSQIPLHDMYVAALREGVPLILEDEIRESTVLSKDFAIHPATIDAFNAWRRNLAEADSVEKALQYGMGQLLTWRTLRAQVRTGQYVTERAFFKAAKEDPQTPRKLEADVRKAEASDPECQRLKAERARLRGERSDAGQNPLYLYEIDAELAAAETALQRRREVLYGQQAGKGGPCRPGEGAADMVTNDQRDLRESAEQMRLLLGHLYRDQLERWEVRKQEYPWNPDNHRPQREPVLSVRHEQPQAESEAVTLASTGTIFNILRTTVLQIYRSGDDLVTEPTPGIEDFLRQHTDPQAVARLDKAAIVLYDDYVHDSRIWFRIPHFHEYAPGGYGWPRVIFTGKSQRTLYLALAPAVNQLGDGYAVA